MGVNRFIKIISALASVWWMIFAAGCGGGGDSVERYEVQGVVYFQEKPIKNASVSFISDRYTAVGMTDEEGKFTLRSGAHVGAPAGQYKVAIIATDEEAVVTANMSEEEKKKAMFERMFGDYKPPKPTVPRRYAKAETSGLTATVTDDPKDNHFEFTLAR